MIYFVFFLKIHFLFFCFFFAVILLNIIYSSSHNILNICVVLY